MARRHHGAGQVDLGHDPAAEDVAVGVGVRRHGDDLQYQFLVGGQGRWLGRRLNWRTWAQSLLENTSLDCPRCAAPANLAPLQPPCPPAPLPRTARTHTDWATLQAPVSLPVAIQVAGDRRAGLHGRRQGGQRRRAGAAEEPGRRDELQAGRPRGRAGRAGRPAGGLRPAALVDFALHRTARTGVRQGDARARRAASPWKPSSTCTR